MNNRKGIIAGGNWIIDRVKIIDTYPEEDALANIRSESFSNGGAAYNVLKDLAKLEVTFPLEGIGMVGKDESGIFILTECAKLGINSKQVKTTENALTSYTDVMTNLKNGRRTFFHYRGANALLDVHHFDFSITRAKIFHLGYLLLLDKLDEIDAHGLTGSTKVLEAAKLNGLETSVDLVSEDSSRFSKVIIPSLPFVDYLFLNEFEAEKLTGIYILDNKNEPDIKACYSLAENLFSKGILQWIVLHFPLGAVAISKERNMVVHGSVKIPTENIKGAAGAGDAFAAGVLLGLHENLPMDLCLEFGVCAAAACLKSPTCSESIISNKSSISEGQKLGFRNIVK